MKINYKEKYKFEIISNYSVNVPIKGYSITHEYFSLDTDGLLTINSGYNSDGVTCFFQLKCLLRAAFTHDCLYQMIRLNMLPSSNRIDADNVFRDTALEDGCPLILAKLVYLAVRIFGGKFIQLDTSDNRYSAP